MTAKSDSHSHKHAETELAQPVKKLVKKTDDKKPDLVGPNDVFTITIAREELVKARQKVLTKAQQQLKTDGFRHGKTPIKIVEQRLGEGSILEMMADEVLSPAYSKTLQEKNLQPLSEPEVKPLKMDAEGDWEFEIIVATLPIFETKEVASLVEKLKKSSELWTKEAEEGSDVRQDRLQAILTTILEKIKVTVPELLLRKETERQLHELAHQLESLELKVEDYLEKIGKTLEELQQEYATRAFGTLQVEIFLANYIRDEKLEVQPGEVETILRARQAKDDKKPISRQEVEYIHATLLKQKAVDQLLTI